MNDCFFAHRRIHLPINLFITRAGGVWRTAMSLMKCRVHQLDTLHSSNGRVTLYGAQVLISLRQRAGVNSALEVPTALTQTHISIQSTAVPRAADEPVYTFTRPTSSRTCAAVRDQI